ncbi:MAG TPA: NAD(P)-dependent oxidoreductase [Acidimicrobiales bacterium]|nr:NAD(P)-dependent oxidoreductase [Acidimicrobiales bacterium]
MRILVAGATGVLGSRAVRILVGHGHEVVGTTRRPDRVATLEEAGASGVVLDALDRGQVRQVVSGTGPDAVIHLLTDLAGFDFAATARLRVEGTRNLVDATLATGITRMVAQSISWAYEPGEAPAGEDVPLATDPGTGAPSFPSIDALERLVLGLPDGVVLRFGLLYGPGTWYAADGARGAEARAGVVDATTARTSFVHVDDAAAATTAALGWPAGVVNIVDDEPTHVDDWGPRYVDAVGGSARSIRSRAEGRSADNARARSLGWTPRHGSWRTSLFDLT